MITRPTSITNRLLAFLALAALLAAVALAPVAETQLAVSSNDNKPVLVNGVVKVVPNPAPDTVTIIDLNGSPPSTRSRG